MLAILCKQYGTPDLLVAEEQAMPEPAAGQVVMQVQAVALSMANVLVIANNHPHPRALPFSPGAEAAGAVLSVGAGVKDLAPGDLVMGQGVNGNCAEAIACEAAQLRRLPPGTDTVLAVAAAGSHATALYGLRTRARLQPGEWVVVLGAAGGVGLAAIQIAKLMGATVVACASSAEKLALCKANGADHLVNYASGDLGQALADLARAAGRPGMDVVVDPVGGPYALAALRSLAWDGRFLSIGYPAGVPEVPLNWLLHERISVLGMSIRELQKRRPADAGVIFDDVMAWLAAGRIRPHIHATYPLADTARALNDLKARRVLGKAVVVTRHRAS